MLCGSFVPVSCDIFYVAFYQCFGLRNVGSSEDVAGKCTKLQMNESGNKMLDHYSAHLVVRFSAVVLETVCIGEEEHGKFWKMLLETNVQRRRERRKTSCG